jgi:rhamnosyltransferase
MKKNVAGVVIFYNPNTDLVISNLQSYLHEVGCLYIVDNSDQLIDYNLQHYIDSNKTIKYISLGKNKGIACALNVGLNAAVNDGYKWAITMDQDSLLFKNTINKMYNYAINIHAGKLGLVSALPQVHDNQPISNVEFENVNSTITSGSLMNLEAFIHVNGFEEKLFIDYVDNIYCFNLRTFGYDVILCNKICFKHSLGEIKQHSFFGIKMFVSHHNHIRRYYITRNRLYYQERFSNSLFNDKFNNTKDVIKIILFEQDKLIKLINIIRGYLDFRRGIFGKYEERYKSMSIN